MLNKTEIFALAAMLLVFATSAQAEDCTLKQAASIPLTVEADGTLTIPIGIEGKDRKFALNLSAGFSMVNTKLVSELGLRTSGLDPTYQLWLPNRVTGKTAYMKMRANIPDIHIGPISGRDVEIRAVDMPDTAADGMIGWDMFRGFDVELDSKDSRLNLFSQDHCEGKVVYWAGSFGVLSLVFDGLGNLHSYANLDDQFADVTLQTAEAKTQMSLQNAKLMFGFKEGDPALKRVEIGWSLPTYSYPFKVLSLGDVTIINPQITLFDEPGGRICNGMMQLSKLTACAGDGDITIGAPEVRKLRLFFAIREKKIYVTAADAQR